MNRLIVLEEEEALQLESERLKKITESIIEAHTRRYQRAIIKQDIENIKNKYSSYIEHIKADKHTQAVLKEMLIWELNQL